MSGDIPGWQFDLYVLPFVVAFIIGAAIVMRRRHLRDVRDLRAWRREQRRWRDAGEEYLYLQELRRAG